MSNGVNITNWANVDILSSSKRAWIICHSFDFTCVKPFQTPRKGSLEADFPFSHVERRAKAFLLVQLVLCKNTGRPIANLGIRPMDTNVTTTVE